MPRRLLIAPLLLLAAACASTPDATVPAGERVGEAVEPRPIVPLATVNASPASYLDQTLLVEATVVAVCQSAGCWMQIEDQGEKAMVRWQTGCGGKYAFPKDAAGRRVVVQGRFYPVEISEDDAAHLEEEAGRELDIERESYEMNASAVVLLETKS